jgi:hypothetical protein
MQKLNDNFDFRGVLTIKKFKDGKLISESGPFKNKVVSSSGYGRNIILRQLAGDITYAVEIDSASFGSGSTAAADGDTALETSVVSGVSITNMVVSGSTLTVDVFVADGTLTNGTYREFGLFCNGRLFARVVHAAYTKASGEDTLFSYTLNATG